MKKLAFLAFLLLLITPAIFAQDPSTPPTGPPGDWGDILINPTKWFADLTAVSFLTAFLTTFFSGLLKIVKAWPRQFLAWGLGVFLVVLSDVLNIGFAKDSPLLLAAIYGLAAGLTSNGLYDIPILNTILTWIESLFNKKVVPMKAAAKKK
jgi:hypothetical protein